MAQEVILDGRAWVLGFGALGLGSRVQAVRVKGLLDDCVVQLPGTASSLDWT